MYRIRATVNDGLVTSKSMDATLMIENPNLPPEITKFDAPATVRTDEAFNVNVAGKDKYGDDNQLKWTLRDAAKLSIKEGGWSDTGIIPNTKEATFTVKADSNKVKKQAGPGKMSLMVEDPTQNAIVESKTINIINEPPKITSYSTTPSLRSSGGTININASANDPDGNNDDLRWSLSRSHSGRNECSNR